MILTHVMSESGISIKMGLNKMSTFSNPSMIKKTMKTPASHLILSLMVILCVGHSASAQGVEKNGTQKTTSSAVVVPGIQPADPSIRVEQPAGQIALNDDITDASLAKTLTSILSKYPGLDEFQVTSSMGVITLSGRVRTNEMVDRIGEFVRQVEGVRLVINLLESRYSHQTSIDRLIMRIGEMARWLQRYWLSLLVALGVILFAQYLNWLLSRHVFTIMSKDSQTPLSKTLILSLGSRILPVVAFLIAIALMDLTDPFFSFFGVAGVLGITMGFAFQQIGENFITSIILGMRRPFQVGDFIEIEGYSGFVKSLTTRATNLLTLDSHLVRIPNSTVYKSILINQSASTNRREMVDLKITSYNVPVTTAQRLMTSIMMKHPAILNQPTPRVLIDALMPDGIVLKAFYWISTKGVDRWLLASQLRLAFKVALNEANIPLDGSAGVSAVSVSFDEQIHQEIIKEKATSTLSTSPSAGLKPTPKPLINKPLDPDSEAIHNNAAMSEATSDPLSEFIQKQFVMTEGRESLFTLIYPSKYLTMDQNDQDDQDSP
jgi:small-conductance mechanosensitive channel